MNVLKIQNTGVVGNAQGSFIFQQFAVTYQEKVNSLVLIALSCGGIESIPTDPLNLEMVMDVINRVANGTFVPSQEVKEVISVGLGSGWLKLHLNILETTTFPEAKHLFSSITSDNNLERLNAGQKWLH